MFIVREKCSCVLCASGNCIVDRSVSSVFLMKTRYLVRCCFSSYFKAYAVLRRRIQLFFHILLRMLRVFRECDWR